jgi:ubiquinone/menaquinone biosynthesis C-methylase UbiE
MLQTAKEALKEANIDPKDCDIKFIKGFSSNTGLPDASVDLITCRYFICIPLQ